MKLSHFKSNEYVEPHVSGLNTATKSFVVGTEDVEWITLDAGGCIVHVRRKRLPDLLFTPMGHGILLGDGTVPGNRSGNPEEEEPEQRKKGKR